MYSRYCELKIREALSDTPVVIITGPRQSGKTTLAKHLQFEDAKYVTLDDITQYGAAKQDPIGYIRNFGTKRAIIDEIQRVPELFLSIKQRVDEQRISGQYLLTGSSNAMMLPTLSDSLAGRIEVIKLLPLTTCEISNTPSTFIDKIFNGEIPTTKITRVRKILIQKILSGGFPEPLKRINQQRRTVWYQQYINSIIQKDLQDLGNLEHIDVMPNLVRLLADQIGNLVNHTEIASKLGISRQTVAHYLRLLEQLYIFEHLPAWHKNHRKRLIKTPKIHIVDTGLLCALRQINSEKITETPTMLGALMESYVINEIRRLTTWHINPIEFSYYRDKDKVEVDLILENYAGKVVGIEIKSGATIKDNDFKGLRTLRNASGKDFLMGIILYDGDHSTQHEERLFSVPIGCLWE